MASCYLHYCYCCATQAPRVFEPLESMHAVNNACMGQLSQLSQLSQLNSSWAS